MHQKIFRAQPCAREKQAAKGATKMVKLYDGGVYLVGGNKIVEEKDEIGRAHV